MSNECDKCGLEDSECHCFLRELEERVVFLEANLEQLTDIVKEISDYIRRDDK